MFRLSYPVEFTILFFTYRDPIVVGDLPGEVKLASGVYI